MAQFLGTVQGQRGEASRLGSKATGLTTCAASWQGAIKVDLYHNAETGKDEFTVRMVPWHGAGASKVLAQGVVGEA